MTSRERVMAAFAHEESHDYILEEAPVENVLAMFDTATERVK